MRTGTQAAFTRFIERLELIPSGTRLVLRTRGLDGLTTNSASNQDFYDVHSHFEITVGVVEPAENVTTGL